MTTEKKKLEMYGGLLGGLIPLLVLIAVLIWISVNEKGAVTAFWTGGWLAIVVGLFLAKDKKHYCEVIVEGIGSKTGATIVAAWLFAGVFGKLMVAGGLVDGLLWLGLQFGATGAVFTVIAFVAAMLFSLGTGTSTGTVLALVPVLYPAGVLLGANPVMLAVGILGGAAFGDNLAPISDTTIVSALTQGAEMSDVVKSRAPLALAAAAICIVVLFIFGGGGTIQATNISEFNIAVDPKGLLVAISFIVVIVSALKGNDIIESLIYGNIVAMVMGVLSGKMTVANILSLPANRGESTGLIEAGISGVTAAIMFALIVLAVSEVLVRSGVMDAILNWALKTVAKTVKQAEFAIIAVTILFSIPIAANAPALMVVGPSFVKPLGEKFKLAKARCANLMDCSVCTLFFTLPWHIAVIVWYGALVTASEAYNIVLPSINVAFLNPYCWAMLAVLCFSVLTGWNRKFDNTDTEKNELNRK